jgi:two-component system, OmpR family, sensor histidine kinase TctE
MRRNTHNPSLKKLLLGWLLGPLLGLLSVASVGAFYIARTSATDAYDKALLDPIQALSQHIDTVNNRPVLNMSPEALHSLFTDTYDSLYYQLATSEGIVFGGTLHLPIPLHLASKPLFYNASINGRDVRVAAMRIQPDDMQNYIVIQIAETLTKRDRNLYEILAIMIAPALLMVFAAVALVWFGINRGLTPLQKLQAEIAARSLRDLRPVPEIQAPEEVRPVIVSLNTLLSNLAAAIDGQQRFLANAAHQLRTPLAGLQTQVEVALRNDMPIELRHIFEQLLIATQRAAHLANQLLTLARAEPGALHLMAMQQLDLAELIEEVIAQWLNRANTKHIDLGFEIETANLWGDPLLIGELIANLIDNAIRYTPKDGYVTVRCYQSDNKATLEVEDNGIGIPEPQREKVLERFYRVDGSPGNGCGLGLAIVQEITKLHEAELIISTPEHGRGTRIIVHFPTKIN